MANQKLRLEQGGDLLVEQGGYLLLEAGELVCSRLSLINLSSPWRQMLVPPDGSITQADRQNFLYHYCGILWAGISPGSNVRFITDMDSGLPVFVTTDLDGTATTVKSVQTGGTKVLSKHAPGGTTKIRVVQ